MDDTKRRKILGRKSRYQMDDTKWKNISAANRDTKWMMPNENAFPPTIPKDLVSAPATHSPYSPTSGESPVPNLRKQTENLLYLS